FHVSAKDVERSAKFYGEAFDWKLKSDMGMVFADTGKGGISGGIATIQDGSGQGSIRIYVGTPNIDAQLARIEKAGGRPVMPKPPPPPGMGWIAGFLDPEGNFVGLWEQAEQPKPAPKRRAAPKKKAAAKKPAAKKAAKKPAKKAAKKR